MIFGSKSGDCFCKWSKKSLLILKFLSFIKQVSEIKTAYSLILKHGDVYSPIASDIKDQFVNFLKTPILFAILKKMLLLISINFTFQIFLKKLKICFQNQREALLLLLKLYSECLNWKLPIARLYSPEDFELFNFSKSEQTLAPSLATEMKQYQSLMYDLQFHYLSRKLISEGKSSRWISLMFFGYNQISF
jgi:hypothetical protein